MKKKTSIGSYIGSYHTGYIWNWWQYPYDLYREAKAFIQRGLYGYAPCDLWSLEWHLSNLIKYSVTELANHKFSHPGFMKSVDEWQAYLLKVSKAIDDYQTIEQNCDYKDVKKQIQREDKAYKNMQKELKNLVDVWGHLWD